ncbi:hypothetical protein [Streptomyces virginiae]|uniref:hypothetical protein n=1 Tax=Streptomyces virginiae TaxID=1961 RepID=UPI003447F65F
MFRSIGGLMTVHCVPLAAIAASMVRVLMERTPNAGPLMAALQAGPGDLDVGVEEALADIARHASLFYADAMPMAASLFADPALLTRHREGAQELGAGPHLVLDTLAARLRRELDAGRLGPTRIPARPPRCCSAPASSGPSSCTALLRRPCGPAGRAVRPGRGPQRLGRYSLSSDAYGGSAPGRVQVRAAAWAA